MLHSEFLKGKNAIVTGAASGIGKATVQVFSQFGANVWACARKPSLEFEDYLRTTETAYGNRIIPVYFDMTKSSDMKATITSIKKEKREIDILVNNAGTSYDALLPMISIQKTTELFDVNFYAHLQMTQLVGRIMMRQGHGSIVNVGSYLGLDGNRGQTIYSASKAAVHGMTKALAKEMGEFGVRVNAVAPGVVNTKLLQTMSSEEYEYAIGKNIMRRAAEPEEIAQIIMVLASDLSSYMTGQIVRVDGGM